MEKSIQLLELLAVGYYTPRHVQIIDRFIKSKNSDIGMLLLELGNFGTLDIAIAKRWYATLDRVK